MTDAAQDTILDRGEWWAIGVTEAWGPPVPYPAMPPREDGSANRGYTDLRAEPDLIQQIPEVADSPGMQALLRAINDPAGSLRSHGCEHGAPRSVARQRPDGPSFAMGAYVDLGFAAPARCGRAEILDLAYAIVKAAPISVRNWVWLDARAQRLKHLVGHPEPYGLYLNYQAFGRSAEEAATIFEANMIVLADTFTALARD